MRRTTNRRVLLGVAGGALAACAQVPSAQPSEPVHAAAVALPEAAPPAAPAPAAPPAPAPEPGGVQPAPPARAPGRVGGRPAPPPVPSLQDLGVGGVVQPVWSGDASRVLFYDQPAPGLSGTWSVDLASGGVGRERDQWGYYVAQGTLL